jgi:hypothetical protein
MPGTSRLSSAIRGETSNPKQIDRDLGFCFVVLWTQSEIRSLIIDLGPERHFEVVDDGRVITWMVEW